jgi:predicted nucleotidyltransferase
MNLDLGIRQQLAVNILRTLERATPNSTAVLRGSLAADRADPYSDIDVLWEVPDASFDVSVAQIRKTLNTVHAVCSLRSDPDLQLSRKRRLFFVRFQDMPLFWRLDLDVYARSINRDNTYDLDNPAARGTDWSLAESALANAVAAIKWHQRGDDATARQLLVRAYERVGLPYTGLPLNDSILGLAHTIKAHEPTLTELVQEIKQLLNEYGTAK